MMAVILRRIVIFVTLLERRPDQAANTFIVARIFEVNLRGCTIRACVSLARHITAVPRRRARPTRWTLLAIVVASLVSLGSDVHDYGRGVGILDDDTLIIEQGSFSSYVSVDGGSTWQPIYLHVDGGRRQVWNIHEDWRDTTHWGDGAVETPRGRYVIEATAIEGAHALVDISIVRIEGDREEVVYSPPHLQNAADARFRDRQHSVHNELPWRAPRNLIYHAPSGNIVAVLGLEGVVVGDAEENWRPLLTEIGDQAIDVSLSNKIAFVLGELWPIAALIAITATAAALASAGQFSSGQTDSGGDFHLFRALVPLIPLLVLLIIIYALVAGFGGDHLFLFNAIASLMGAAIAIWRKERNRFGVLSFLAGPTVPLIAAIAILGLVDWRINQGGLLTFFTSIASLAGAVVIWWTTRVLAGVSSLVLACIVSAVGLAVVHAHGPSGGVSDVGAAMALGLAIFSGFLWSLLALISFIPSFVRQFHVVFIALGSMTGLVALAFAIGVAQGFNLGAAKLYTIVLVFSAVWSLRWYLLRCQNPS